MPKPKKSKVEPVPKEETKETAKHGSTEEETAMFRRAVQKQASESSGSSISGSGVSLRKLTEAAAVLKHSPSESPRTAKAIPPLKGWGVSPP